MTGGDIVIGDQIVNNLAPRDRNIAMVFQSYALYPHMTVAQNMGFNLKLAGRPKAEINQRVAEAARMLDLSELLQRRPAQLSGGQRQRVAMGRAVVRNPNVFLFDEPLSNLDAKLRVQMRSEIKILHQRVATTTIYVTHDQIEAMTLADQIVVLNFGRIEQQGTPIELYRKPANQFVAGFIGSPAMNFMTGTIRVSGESRAAELADGTKIELGPNVRADDGQAVTVGMRPENIVVGGRGSAIGGNIKIVEPTGAQTLIHFVLGAQDVTAVVDGGMILEPGSVFAATVSPDLVHIFETGSGRRLN
jgi:multiple sugar transport system ATP-binding protein